MNKILTKEYYKIFWVGLMDGDGSIQVNHWKKKYLQFRLVIKLKYSEENYQMLLLIKKSVGGSVNIINDQFVVWVENNKEIIIKYHIPIFLKYPPLTTRLSCQLYFLNQFINTNNITLYLRLREKKYENYLLYEKKITQNISIKTKKYFYIWLSGFIEAKGCFSIGALKRNKIFSIGQTTDLFLLTIIKNHFSAHPNKIRCINKTGKNFYLLEIGSKICLQNIYSHCSKYPLLGFKQTQFLKFYAVK